MYAYFMSMVNYSISTTINVAKTLFYRVSEDGINRTTEDNQQRITED